MLFVTALTYQTWRSSLLDQSLTFLALSVCFLRKQSSLTGVTLQTSDQLPDQVVQSQPFKQGKFVFRRRKRILSQNKRWGANPFPCAVKQSFHSRLPKWHLIWVWCWSRRYPERFQDIYSVCCATLARYEGARNLMNHHTTTHTHMHTHQHPGMKRQVVDIISQDASGHVKQRWSCKSRVAWKLPESCLDLKATLKSIFDNFFFFLQCQKCTYIFSRSYFQPGLWPNWIKANWSIVKKQTSNGFCKRL